MEKEKNIEAKAESQIREASSLPFNRSGNWEQTERSNFNNNLTGNWPVMCGDFNIFLIQNKGKGPPGKARSPGIPVEFIPDRVSNPVRDDIEPFIVLHGHPLKTKHIFRHRFQSLSKGNTEYNFLQSINSNFLQTLNFKIMKKQILILAMITLAFIFAGTKSYGQVVYPKVLSGAPVCATAVPLTCATENELAPLPGKVYTYSINVDGGAPPAGTKILWYVTNQATIISGAGAAPALTPAGSRDGNPGTYVLTATSPYNDPTNTSASIDISWKSFDGNLNKVVLVAYVINASGCTDNVEVYRIKPSFAFTLDLVALLDDGNQGSTECVSSIESASTDGTNLTMNYGENWVFFSVTAANFVNSWLPSFSVISYTGAGGVASVPTADIQWAYSANAQSALVADWHAVTVPVTAQVAGGAVGAAGECIIVRARIVHGSSPTAGTLTFGVNGIMYDPATTLYATTTLKDLDAPTAPAVVCDNNVTDQVTYTLSPRPAITTTTGAPLLPFLIKN